MGFAARLALCCALGLFPLGAARAAEPTHLLARMRAASGPVWRTHLRSVSRLTIDGETTTIQSDALGVRFVTRECNGVLCPGTYFDGRRLYSININGTTLPRSTLPETYLRGIRIVSSLVFLSRDFTSGGGSIEDAGTATIAGARYRVLLVSDADAVPMQVFVDPATAFVRYMRDIDGDGTFEYRHYQRLDGGITLPSLVLHNDTVLERYDQREASPSPFVVPHGLAVTFAGAAMRVPTDPSKAVPVFPCTIAGVAVRCLLDTGNSGLSISQGLAERLKAPSVGAYSVAGLGRYVTDVVRVGPLTIGNARFPDADYVVLHDISHYGYDVVLGADVLAATTIEIDPVSHTLWLGASAPNNAISVPMAFEDFIPVVNVQLGELQAHLAVDTGDESNINLSYDFYQQHPTLFRATEQRSVSGIGGNSVELIGHIPSVTIGSYQTSPQRIGTTESLRGTAYGHLGAAFFSQFKVILDYENGHLGLIPGPATNPTKP